eukprot:4085874-Pleurochrysis_carterae.AAC.3
MVQERAGATSLAATFRHGGVGATVAGAAALSVAVGVARAVGVGVGVPNGVGEDEGGRLCSDSRAKLHAPA